MSSAPNRSRKPVKIFIENIPHEIARPTLTGAEIRRLGYFPRTDSIFLEQAGEGPDRQIKDDETVRLRKEMKFYFVPPGTFGAVA